jgi:hypothetical protein
MLLKLVALIALMTVLSLVRCILWAYEPISGEFTSDFFYPWFFYAIPELGMNVPMLLFVAPTGSKAATEATSDNAAGAPLQPAEEADPGEGGRAVLDQGAAVEAK